MAEGGAHSSARDCAASPMWILSLSLQSHPAEGMHGALLTANWVRLNSIPKATDLLKGRLDSNPGSLTQRGALAC